MSKEKYPWRVSKPIKIYPSQTDGLQQPANRQPMNKSSEYMPTAREQAFVNAVNNSRYPRQIVNGLRPFTEGQVPDDMKNFYSRDELAALADLEHSPRSVPERMPIKITRHYFEQAKHSKPLQALVKASPKETLDLSGVIDPGHQMDYSPLEGLIHKYGMGLLYVASTCSAHCRFCYREELIARKGVLRPDGTTAPKSLAQVGEVVAYIREHNVVVARHGGRHPESGRAKLREMLLSGGDPMVLSNTRLATWLAALAEAGTEVIRIGTKELAFYPDRFDESFLAMLDAFHAAYPDVSLRLMVHFNHPDEFLFKDADAGYVENPGGTLRWIASTRRALKSLTARDWILVENQAPIIKGINDDPDALRIMQRELKHNLVENHYFFCGRDIVGHRAFNVPIEEAWRIVNDSQKGLSGVEAHARLTISHHQGKTEVAAVTERPMPGVPGTEHGFVIFKQLRSPGDADLRGKVAIVGRNPEAIWFNDYEDRVIFDEAGLFT